MKVLRSALASGLLLAACQGVPEGALKLSEVSMERRQLQTRRYQTTDEEHMLITVAHLLQDLGFHLEESDTGSGVIVGSKMRDAEELDQQIGAFILGALAGTTSRGGNAREDRALARRLLASGKERGEHQIVVDAILKSISGLGEIQRPPEPSGIKLSNLQHLSLKNTQVTDAGVEKLKNAIGHHLYILR